jgi:hypothetical protein
MPKDRDPYRDDLFVPPPRKRRNPKPYFHAGQRVVCADASPNRLASGRKLLVGGKIYIIRAIDVRPGGSGHGGAYTSKTSNTSIWMVLSNGRFTPPVPTGQRTADQYHDFQGTGRVSNGGRGRDCRSAKRIANGCRWFPPGLLDGRLDPL